MSSTVCPREESAIEKVIQAFSLLKEACNSLEVNPIDNYAFRDMGAIHSIREHFEPTIEQVPGRTGPDAKTAYRSKVEGKSRGVKPKKTIRHLRESDCTLFQFDKQNDPIRREETLQYDGFYFHVHRAMEVRPAVLIYIDGNAGVLKVRRLLESKQSEFLQKWSLAKQQGRRVRDTIELSLTEIFDVCEDYDLNILANNQIVSKARLREMFENKEIVL